MNQRTRLFLLIIFLAQNMFNIYGATGNDTARVYVFPIKEQIAPPVVRTAKESMQEAIEWEADYIIIHMNTYGGMVNAADSIRTRILNSAIPVYTFIDNNAASAGALISIASDSIYMRPGGNIGAATVVTQQGEAAPDKYQSYMRSTMRSTAQAHGKDTIINENDTILKWRRDPTIAEAMVDPSIYIPGIIDSGKVLTFTAEEAIRNGFCEGTANNIDEVLKNAGIQEYVLKQYTPSGLDKAIHLLLSPVLQGILLMIIIGGIYFELQSPGIGFPLAAAVLAAILYFAPLYLEGLAENWELILFVLGIILLGVEIFVIPGFGVAGIAGIALMVTGLTLAMIDNIVFSMDPEYAIKVVLRSVLIIVLSSIGSILIILRLGKSTASAGFLGKLALEAIQDHAEGYVSSDPEQKKLIGKTGIALTDLKPSGKIEVEDDVYVAMSEIGYIPKGTEIKIIRDESSHVYVIKTT